MRNKLARSVMPALFGSLVACSGSSSGGLLASDGGVASDATSGGGGVIVPSGTCRFVFHGRDGSGAPRQGKATARMNGSGNVIVLCADLEQGREQIQLDLGNGTYDGPRTYVLSSDHADGSATFRTSETTSFVPTNTVTSGCKVDVTSPTQEFLPRGAVLVGSFACQKLSLDAADGENSTIDITEGQFAAPVR